MRHRNSKRNFWRVILDEENMNKKKKFMNLTRIEKR